MSESYAATTKCESCPSPSWGKRFCESCTPPDAEAVARERAIAAVLACRDGLIVADVRDRELLSWVEAVERRVRADADAEVERLRELLEDFFDEDVEALRLHPDIPWGIGGKSGAERVAEWRKDLADRIERILAANRAAQDHHTTGGASDA